jgi:putative spermidine/putrescine transport system permease protein
MTDQTHPQTVLTTQDGVPLKVSIARALRAQKIRAALLVAPLFLFILISFVLPIADMLYRSVENNIVPDTLPQTVVALQAWDESSGELPPEEVFAAMAEDLKVAVAEKTHTRVGSRLNYEKPGISSLFRKSGRQVRRFEEGKSYKEQFVDADDDWGDPAVWQTIKQFSSPVTAGYFLAAADAERTPDGLRFKSEDDRIYLFLFGRTLVLSVTITLSCILLGYPIAFLLASLPLRSSNLLMILVLLPFWTSLLVRTSAWKVLLQQQGVINDTLVWLGIVSDSSRLAMINNQTGTIIAMTHILLPFMILPLFSVMKTISPTYMRAAKSMGASDWYAFWRVYFPQTVPGIGAGSILVFILSIGYYITPELVGGTSGIFISNRIAYHISSSLNWGLAAALGVTLLVVVMVLYWLYDKIVGIDNVKLG